MKKIVNDHPFDFLRWNERTPEQQRMDALRMSDDWVGGWKTVISDLDGRGWYVGTYQTTPLLVPGGRVVVKTTCVSSATYKDEKLYGKMCVRDFIENLMTHIREFQFLQKMPMNIICKDYIMKAILSKKVTSQEGIWKLLAKKSYKTKQWKAVKLANEMYIPFYFLQQCCSDWEAINSLSDNDMHRITNDYSYMTMLKDAIVLGEKVSIKWSEKRIAEESARMRRTVKRIGIGMLSKDPVYDLTNILLPYGFTVVNTQLQAFDTAEYFHNCVYSNYWSSIRAGRYIVIEGIVPEGYKEAGQSICIGYRLVGEDMTLDQMCGMCNGYISKETKEGLNILLRDIAQEIGKHYITPKLPERVSEELPW